MTENLERLMAQVKEENAAEIRSEKACLIEDIAKIKRLMYGLGMTQHDEFTNPAKQVALFDYLYDLPIESLEVILKGYNKQYREKAKQLINQ